MGSQGQESQDLERLGSQGGIERLESQGIERLESQWQERLESQGIEILESQGQ